MSTNEHSGHSISPVMNWPLRMTTLLRGTRLVIPSALQKQALNLSHEGHQGIVKNKETSQRKVMVPWNRPTGWKPGGKVPCLPCNTGDSLTEPLHMSQLPYEPWTKLGIDFCGPFLSSDYSLVVTDEYSRFPEIDHKIPANQTVITKNKILATHGIPVEIKSDNGPPFNI